MSGLREGKYWDTMGCIGIREKEMETTIMGYVRFFTGFEARVYSLPLV